MNSIEKEFLRSVGFKNTDGSWSVKYNPALDGGTDFGMSRLARLAEAWLDGYDQWRLTISVDDDTKDADCTMAHSGGVLESNMGGEDILFNIASCIIGLENPGMKKPKKHIKYLQSRKRRGQRDE